LVLAFAVILALVTPFATYATSTAANEPVTTSETANEAVTTSENSDANTTKDETASTEETQTEKPEEITGAYHHIGFDYTFDKIVDGNAFIIGNNITISAKVNGELYDLSREICEDASFELLTNVSEYHD
jgi:hypothetical protein